MRDGATVIESTSTVIFKGDAETHSETHATYTPAMGGVNGMTLIQDQSTWAVARPVFSRVI